MGRTIRSRLAAITIGNLGLWIALGFDAAASFAGCTEPQERISVMGSIDADSDVRGLIAEVEARIDSRRGDSGGWTLLRAETFDDAADNLWPLSLRGGPVPNEPSMSYQLVATARDASGAVLVQSRARGTLDQVKRTGLRVQFESSCLRRPMLCGAGLTCSGGTCVEATATPPSKSGAPPASMDKDAGPPPEMIASAGAPCDTAGARACAGFASRTPLACADGSWRVEPQCSATMRCDSSTGTCRVMPRECRGQEADIEFCDAETMRVCSRDLTSSESRPCAENERCATSTAGEARCECSPGFVLEHAMCSPPSGCKDNGGCDSRTICSATGGNRVCSTCPAGYDGKGETGCVPQLAMLKVAEGELVPAFAPTVTLYRVRVPLMVDRVSLTMIAPEDARIAIDGSAAEGGKPWSSPALMLGENTIDITVSTEVGASRTYSVVAERVGKQEAYVKPPNPSVEQGYSYALQLSGDTVAVAAPADSSGATGVNPAPASSSVDKSGAVWVWVRKNDAWVQQAFLKPEMTSADAMFGTAIALSGDTLAVGEVRWDIFNVDSLPTRSGLVHIFTRKDGAWSRTQTLPSPSGAADLFGYSMSMSGDTLAVGANLDGNGGIGSGAVYVFTRSNAMWSLQQKIKPAEPHSASQFGSAVSLSGDTLAVSAGEDPVVERRAGAVYLFERQGTEWTERKRFEAEPPIENGAFGFDLSLRGDRLAVGAPHFRVGDASAIPSGAVYLYERTGGTWTRKSILKAQVPAAADFFGAGVSFSDTALLVGASGDASGARGLAGTAGGNDAPFSGAAYLFARRDEGWEITTFFKAENAETDDAFGLRVALSDDTVVIGALQEDNGLGGLNPAKDDNTRMNSGAVYMFR